MMVVQMISLMLKVDLYVIYIIICLLLNAWFTIVMIKGFKGHLPVKNINHSGENILKTATTKINLEFVECYKGLVRIILGNLTIEGQIHNSMMIQMLIQLPHQTTLVHLGFIVLKLSVLLVG